MFRFSYFSCKAIDLVMSKLQKFVIKTAILTNLFLQTLKMDISYSHKELEFVFDFFFSSRDRDTSFITSLHIFVCVVGPLAVFCCFVFRNLGLSLGFGSGREFGISTL